MASTSVNENINSSELKSNTIDTAPGVVPLYFNNQGLFSDPFLSDHLKNIELKGRQGVNSYLIEHWCYPDDKGVVQYTKDFEAISARWEKFKDILPSRNEAQLEERWIKPIFDQLGWAYQVQPEVKKRGKLQRPDYCLYADDKAAIDAEDAKTYDAKFSHALAIADAKAWSISLDGEGRSNSNPSYQIMNYLDVTGKTWGILTNGKYWRLYSKKSNLKHRTYYEVNIEKLLTKGPSHEFKYFYNFFRKEAFLPLTPDGQCFLDLVFSEGEYYAKDVEGNLKSRIFHVVESMAKGFLEDGRAVEKDELKEVYNHSLYFLFRLMFILNCESKGLLQVTNQKTYGPSSLRELISTLKKQWETGANWHSQYTTYDRLLNLFKLLKKGCPYGDIAQTRFFSGPNLIHNLIPSYRRTYGRTRPHQRRYRQPSQTLPQTSTISQRAMAADHSSCSKVRPSNIGKRTRYQSRQPFQKNQGPRGES